MTAFIYTMLICHKHYGARIVKKWIKMPLKVQDTEICKFFAHALYFFAFKYGPEILLNDSSGGNKEKPLPRLACLPPWLNAKFSVGGDTWVKWPWLKRLILVGRVNKMMMVLKIFFFKLHNFQIATHNTVNYNQWAIESRWREAIIRTVFGFCIIWKGTGLGSSQMAVAFSTTFSHSHFCSGHSVGQTPTLKRVLQSPWANRVQLISFHHLCPASILLPRGRKIQSQFTTQKTSLNKVEHLNTFMQGLC